jgi:hypothetical protein
MYSDGGGEGNQATSGQHRQTRPTFPTGSDRFAEAGERDCRDL